MRKKQNCPLCGNPAEFAPFDHGNKKYFWCNTCIEFIISLGAEDILKSSIAEWRSQNSAKAKHSNATQVWEITKSNTPKQEGVANAVLNGMYTLRSELPT